MYGKDVKRVRSLSTDDVTYIISVLMEKCYPNDNERQHTLLGSLTEKVEF